MYTTLIIELSMNACAYQLERIFLAENPHHVRKVYGRVPIARKVTINGERKTIVNYKKFRWNDAGQCFSDTPQNANVGTICLCAVSRNNKNSQEHEYVLRQGFPWSIFPS